MSSILPLPALQRIALFLTFMLTMVLAPPAQAQEDAEALFALSGLDTAFARAPDVVVMVAQELGADAPTLALWSDSARRAFAPETMTARARALFAERIKTDALPALIAFRTSPLGRAVTEAEISTNTLSTPEVERRDALRPEIEADMTADRRALNARLTALTAFPGVEAGLVGMVEALLAPLLPADQVAGLVAQLETDLGGAETTGDDTAMFTYHQLSDAEIAAYIAHLETPEGRAYHAAMVAALEGALFESIDALRADFAAQF